MLPVGFSNGSGLALANRSSVSGPALNPVVAAQPKFSAQLQATINHSPVTPEIFLKRVKGETPEEHWPTLVKFFKAVKETAPQMAKLGDKDDMFTINFDPHYNNLSAYYNNKEGALVGETDKIPLLTHKAEDVDAIIFKNLPHSWLREITEKVNPNPPENQLKILEDNWLG